MEKGKDAVLVSACLLGVNCRHDGENNFCESLIKKLVAAGTFLIPVCPEQLGGLSTPRTSFEITGGDGFDVLEGRAQVTTKTGEDFTKEFIKGARETLEIVKRTGAKRAVLKSRSPSCGAGKIYDGSFSGRTNPGFGVAAALLKKNGMLVVTDEEFI